MSPNSPVSLPGFGVVTIFNFSHFDRCVVLFHWSLFCISLMANDRRRQWHPTPVLLPGKSQWWRSLVGCSPWGREESDTTEWLHFHFSFHALEKEMATHSSVLAWRIPGTGEPDGLPSMGSHRVGHDWSDLAAAVKTLEYAKPHYTCPWNKDYLDVLTYFIFRRSGTIEMFLFLPFSH